MHHNVVRVNYAYQDLARTIVKPLKEALLNQLKTNYHTQKWNMTHKETFQGNVNWIHFSD